MNKLTILFYTDHPSVADPGGIHSLSTLQGLLESNKPTFLDEFTIEIINRFEDPQNPSKLTKARLDQFDEVWFFGKYQARVEGEFKPQYGGLDNELDDGEVQALGEWMEEKRGGVLITGDHSQINLPEQSSFTNQLYCRGRALGYRIPRARALRVWEGPPTNEKKGSFNTLVLQGVRGPDDSPELQEDDAPQTIQLIPFGLDGSPHPIFMGKRQKIEILPDHMHEGAALAPSAEELSVVEELIENEWPKVNEKIHRPRIVAYGFDKRSLPPQPTGVVAVYDGDPVNRGRIVADSSWHHYVDPNLRRLGRDGDDSNLDLMSQFYRNLVVWLAPRALREAMSHEVFGRIALHPDVEEEIGNDLDTVGAVTLKQLVRVATRGEVSEFIQAVAPPPTGVDSEPLLFPTARLGLTDTPSQELVVGAIVNQFQQRAFAVTPLATSEATPASILSAPDDVLAAVGLGDAFRKHNERMAAVAGEARDKLERYERSLRNYLG